MKRFVMRFANGEEVPLFQFENGQWACPVCGEETDVPAFQPSPAPGMVSEVGLWFGDVTECGVWWGEETDAAHASASSTCMHDQFAAFRIRWLNRNYWAPALLEQVERAIGMSREVIEAEIPRLTAQRRVMAGRWERWSGALKPAPSRWVAQARELGEHRRRTNPLYCPTGSSELLFPNGERLLLVRIGKRVEFGSEWDRSLVEDVGPACLVCGSPGQPGYREPYFPGRTERELAMPNYGQWCRDCSICHGIDDECATNRPIGYMKDLYAECRIRWLAWNQWVPDAIGQLGATLGLTEERLRVEERECHERGCFTDTKN